jgi:hypothetical protein
MASPDSLPIVRTPGEIVGAPPYRARGCLTQGFFLKGDRTAQQVFCDTVLNHPADGVMTFRAVTDEVLVTAIYVDTMSSLDPIDASKGVSQEWDVAFWTAVHGGRSDTPEAWSTYWLPSFMFVDSTWAMAAGRESYGYPKTTALYSDRRPDDRADPTVTLTAAHFPRFAPTQRPVTEPLVRITSQAAPLSPAEAAADLEAAWALFEGLKPLEGVASLPPWPHISMPQILFRQSRDPVILGRATQQAIYRVAPTVDELGEVGLLNSHVEVALTPSASHPIMETLGLQRTQTGTLGLWVTQDFDVPPAKLLWSA